MRFGAKQEVALIKDLYNEMEGGDSLRGIKCPRDLESADLALLIYRDLFPRTKLIVGVRHPILWYVNLVPEVLHGRKEKPHQLIGSLVQV